MLRSAPQNADWDEQFKRLQALRQTWGITIQHSHQTQPKSHSQFNVELLKRLFTLRSQRRSWLDSLLSKRRQCLKWLSNYFNLIQGWGSYANSTWKKWHKLANHYNKTRSLTTMHEIRIKNSSFPREHLLYRDLKKFSNLRRNRSKLQGTWLQHHRVWHSKI